MQNQCNRQILFGTQLGTAVLVHLFVGERYHEQPPSMSGESSPKESPSES